MPSPPTDHMPGAPLECDRYAEERQTAKTDDNGVQPAEKPTKSTHSDETPFAQIRLAGLDDDAPAAWIRSTISPSASTRCK